MFDSDQLAYIKEKDANKLKSFADNPDDLYTKYLDNVGRIKSEGGILNSGGGLVPDFYSNDPVEIGEKALRNLAEQEGLPFHTHELSKILNTNTNYAHQGLVDQSKNGRSIVSFTGETIDDLKANPKYSPSGSATIEEIETVLKKEQVQMMRSRASGLPTGSAAVADSNARAAAAATKKPLIQPDKADFLPQQMVNGRSVNKVPSAMSVEELVDRRAKVYDKLLDPEYANVHPSSTGTGAMHNVDRGTIGHIDTELAKRGEDISMLPDAPAYDSGYAAGSGKRAPYLRSKEPIATPPTPESLGAPSAAKVQGTVGETKAEEVVAKVTTSAESAPVKMGEAASETVTGVKATVDKGVTIGRTVLKDAGSKAKNFIDTGAKSATKLEGKGGLIGAGVAAAAAVVAFGAHRHHKTQEHQRSSGGPSEASQGQRGGSFEGYMQSSGAHIQMNGAGYDNPEMQTARFKPIDSGISDSGNSFSNVNLSNLSPRSAIMNNYSDSHKAGSTPDRMKSWQFLRHVV
jgi:hypothetical protein